MQKTTYAVRIAALVALVGGLAVAAATWDPQCDETRNGTYQFQSLGGTHQVPVQLMQCATPTCAQPSMIAKVEADTFSMPKPNDVDRPYFLVTRAGVRKLIAARRLALEGAYNFRDLGGIETRDGKRTRWGLIFRSDALDHLTAADYKRLNGLGISLVCDLRTREERKSAPTEWAEASPVFVLAPVSETAKGDSRNSGLTDALSSGKLSVDAAREIFEGFYVRTILDSASKFGVVLRALETSGSPAMFHCMGGRDRTGMTAALLLTILGVPQERIEQDFVLSTQYLNERPGSQPQTDAQRYQAQVIELQPRYVRAILGAINQKYGSFETYRREALGLSDADVEKLKSRLLE